MVPRGGAVAALAGRSSALLRLGVGNHAPADAGRGGHALFRALHRRAAERPRPCLRRRRRFDEALGGARILQPRPEPEKGRRVDRGKARRKNPARFRRTLVAARRRTVYGGRDCVHRIRRAHSRCGRQRAPRRVAADRVPRRHIARRDETRRRRRSRRRHAERGRTVQPGDDGARRAGLPAPRSPLRGMPAFLTLPRPRRRTGKRAAGQGPEKRTPRRRPHGAFD